MIRELSITEAAQLAPGAELHFTNHPCRPSVPCTLLEPRTRLIEFGDGRQLHAFADELTTEPRPGLGQ